MDQTESSLPVKALHSNNIKQENRLNNFIEDNLQRWQLELAELCALPGMAAEDKTESLKRTAQAVKATMAARQIKTERWNAEGSELPFIFGKLEAKPGAKTLLFYNYYDVQPVGSHEKWLSDPFTLTERDGCWWGRGVAANKGNLVARLAAIETYRAVYGELPVNIKFILEGENGAGSPYLTQLVETRKTELAADAFVWETGQYTDDGTPMLSLGLKGFLSVELASHTIGQDAYSGLAGVFPSAAWRLIWALASINDDKDGIQINGFYDDISVPTREDSVFLAEAKKRYAERSTARLAHFGVDEYTAGVQGLPLLITEFFTPTANVSGIESGYTGPGTLEIMPAYASAKIDFRLVPDQEPQVLLKQLKSYLERNRFEDIEVRVNGAQMKPARTSPSDPFVQVAIKAGLEVSGVEPLLIPIAPASGPLHIFKESLNDLPAVGAGVCYDGSNLHAPNENIRSEDFVRHIKFIVQLIHDLAGHNNEQTALPEIEVEPFSLDFPTNGEMTKIKSVVPKLKPGFRRVRARRSSKS